MAQLFPDTQKTRVIFASRAEEQFYQACAQQLGKDWRVYSSCTLSVLESGHGMKDNEIDFVLYHPNFGVIVIEIKGGRIRYNPEQQTFYSINRFNEEFKIKNPFKQVLVWKSRFIRYIRRSNIYTNVCHAVCLPAVLESEIPEAAEFEPQLVIGKTRLSNLETELTRIAQSSRGHYPSNQQDYSEEIDKILRGSHFSTRLHIRDYLDNHELRLRDFEIISETLVTPIANAKRLGIEGEAGTGKTMLAILVAKHFKTKGKKVLLLSSNPLMNSWIRKQAGEGVKVKTYNEIANAHSISLHKKPADFDGDMNDWIQLGIPEHLQKAIIEKEKHYDVILCDEAQDVQPFWWEALTALKASEDSHFYIFFDRSQGVFGSGGKEHTFIPEDVLPIAPPWFPLVHNYRTTREISGFSRQFRTGKAILQSHSSRFGYRPEIIEYSDQDDFKRQMKQLFRKLFEEEGIRNHEVAILSARTPSHVDSQLHGLNAIGNYPLIEVSRGHQKKDMPTQQQLRGRIPVSTIESFKGLETPIGIVVNISEHKMALSNPIMSSLLYVACTRAKHMLYLFVKKNDPKITELNEALTQVKETGALILEGSNADYEFIGEVTHYNPERLGWLKVEDAAFQQSGILFFPHDVKIANISIIKKGKKLRFRPKAEANFTIAVNLKEI
ncbi:MAG: NERD domain-containing protein [Pseudomonadota bacterium]